MSSTPTTLELLASAQPLNVAVVGDSVFNDSLNIAGQLRMYQYTAAATGRMTINMSGGGIDSYLQVFNSNGRRIKRNNNASRTTLDSRIRMKVKAGRSYYILASGANGTSGDYSLTITNKPKDDFGNEFETARNIKLSKSRGSKSFRGRINYGEDVDTFSFVATKSGLMDIFQTATGRRNELQGELQIYDVNGSLLASSNSANGMASLDVVRGERYYLRVTSEEAGTGKYKVNIRPTQTHLFSTAEDLDLPSTGSVSTVASRALATAARGYKFTASASGIVYIDMTANGGSEIDSYLRVYNSKGRRLKRNDNANKGTLDSRVKLKVKAGRTYYIEADADLQTEGLYTLRLTSVPKDDIGDSFAYAKMVRLNKHGARRTGGKINFGDDTDVFGMVATKTGVMSIEMLVRGKRNDLTAGVSAYDSEGKLLTQGQDGSEVTFDVVAGKTYYIKSSSTENSTGKYRVNISTGDPVVPPPPPAPDSSDSPDSSDLQEQEVLAAGDDITAEIISQSNGLQLLVTGTDDADTILISQSGSQITLTTSAGSYIFAGSFSSVVVYGFGGADTIRLDNTVTAAGWIYAGAGNDTIYEAGSGAATIYGGLGEDLLVSVGGNNDTLYGGGGLDSFWLDSSDVVADTSTSETLARSVHQITEFYQPYSNDAWTESYVSMEIAGQDFIDPTTTYYASGYANFAYMDLFVDGPQYNDVAQGAVGDCYLLASLASLANTDSQVISEMITPLGDGTFAVRFYRGGEEVYLRVDADLPVNYYGSPAYAKFGSDGELWVPLVEKAYAFFRRGQNSYASISGGWMADVYREVTNLPYAFRWTSGTTGGLFDFFERSLDNGHAVTLGTYSNSSGPIVGSHAYVVMSVETTNEGQFVTVYNPWGVDGRSWDDNPSDGLLTISIEQVQEHFFAAVVSAA